MLAFLLASSITAAAIHGAWSAVVKGDRAQLNMVRDHSTWGRTLPRSEFAVSDDELNSAAETPVRFSMKRDAGTIDFIGTFLQGEGVGRFAFTANPEFASTLQSLGVASGEPLDDKRLFSLAMHDISVAFIREMQSLGYREDLEWYVRFRIHGVSPQFVRDIKELGFAPSAEDLVRFRIHGMSPEYVRGMRELGVTGLSPEALVRMRIHGVSTEFVRELRDLGYHDVSSDDLVRMRIHDVSPDFIRELANAGYHGIPIDKLVQMRIRGITAAMLAKQ